MKNFVSVLNEKENKQKQTMKSSEYVGRVKTE